MRLIDADDFRDLLDDDPTVTADIYDKLDATPTIECEACEHFRLTDFSNSCDYCQCGSEFQRRQP